MKIADEFKLEKIVAGKDEAREVLHYVNVRQTESGQWIAEASNGAAVAFVPVETSDSTDSAGNLTAGLIPIEARCYILTPCKAYERGISNVLC